MRTLVLLRHAKSDWSGDEPDILRPLGKRGLRQAPEAGQWLAGSLDRIDLAVVSPARRARATWDLVSTELPSSPRLVIEDKVYAASGRQLLEVVQGLPDDEGTVALVGHNPGMEELVSLLTGEWVTLPTSAVAVIELEEPWAASGTGPATLRASGRPWVS